MTDPRKKALSRRARGDDAHTAFISHAGNERSELDKLLDDPDAAIEIAAAALDQKMHAVLWAAFDARTDISQRDLAGMLHVTEGRVSQVLNTDDSVRVATVARYLRALGYELEVVPMAVDPGVPQLKASSAHSRTGVGGEFYFEIKSEPRHPKIRPWEAEQRATTVISRTTGDLYFVGESVWENFRAVESDEDSIPFLAITEGAGSGD